MIQSIFSSFSERRENVENELRWLNKAEYNFSDIWKNYSGIQARIWNLNFDNCTPNELIPAKNLQSSSEEIYLFSRSLIPKMEDFYLLTDEEYEVEFGWIDSFYLIPFFQLEEYKIFSDFGLIHFDEFRTIPFEKIKQRFQKTLEQDLISQKLIQKFFLLLENATKLNSK